MSDSISEKVGEAVTGRDEPIGKKHPEATWSFIWFIYPVVLIAIVVGILLFTGLGQ